MITKWDIPAKYIQTVAFRRYFGRKKANITEPATTPRDFIREDGVRVITEVPYADKYPNSFLDIYLPRQEFLDKAGKKGVPVFLYFHGGGFLYGTKDFGDPFAKVSSGLGWLFQQFLDRGVAVASGAYAFAPKYRFPVQIEQTDQALAFLYENAAKYGFDNRRMLLGGGSAGADMTEVYGLVLSDDAYAAKFPFQPSIPRESLIGLMIDEAALDMPNFRSKGMDLLLGCWVGENNLQKGKNSGLVNVPRHIRGAYIPTYVTGSNDGHCFADSARQLKEKLDEIQVPCKIYIPPMEMGTFTHGFMTEAGSPASAEAMELLGTFLDEVLGATGK